MKANHFAKRQYGFFDLGLSVLVLALAGGIIYGAEHSQAEQRAAAQQSIAAVEAEAAVTAVVAAGDATVIAGTPQ